VGDVPRRKEGRKGKEKKIMSVEKTIDIIFAGTDRVSGTLSDIGGSLDDFGSGLGDISKPFEDITLAVGVAQLAIAGLATAGFIAAGDIETETGRMVNALALPAEEAEKFQDIATDAYATGFTDDLAKAFDAVILAQQKFGDNSGTDIGKVVDKALVLQRVFDVDLNNSMGAVSLLMSDFGIDASTAFDLIADGYQKGLDGSGDFLDSIMEYGHHFSEGGFSAEEFFSVMETGFRDGVEGTDYALDAIKEFSIKIKEQTKPVQEALQKLGIDPVALEASMNAGETTIIDAFELIQKKIADADKGTDAYRAGIELVGSRFEDMGAAAFLALDKTKLKIDDIRGTMDNMTFDDFQTRLTGAWRTAVIAVSTLPEWGDIGKKVADVAEGVGANFATVIGDYDFSPLMEKFNGLWDDIGSIFTDAGFDLTSIDGMKSAIGLAVDSIGTLIDITKGQISVIKPILLGFSELVGWFNDLDSGTKELAGKVMAIGTGLGIVAGTVSVGSSLLSGLGSLVGILSGPVGLAFALTAVAGALAVWLDDFTPMPESYWTKPRDLLNEFKEDIELFPTEVATKLTAAIDDGASTQEVMEIIQEGIDITDQHFDLVFGEEGLEEIEEDLYDIPDEKPVMVKVDGEWTELGDLETKLDEFEDTTIDVGVEVDSGDVKEVKETIEVIVGEGDDTRIVSIEIEANGAAEAKKEIDDIPSQKLVEIRVQGEIDTAIAEIESRAAIVQTSFEWKAKVDISEAQTQAEIITSAYGSVSDSITSTGDVISSSIGALAGVSDSDGGGFMKRYEINEQLDIENEHREKAFKLQKKLTDSQTDYMDAKTKQLADGDAAIQIDSTGLEPALEMIMWQIIEKVQVKANEEAADFLLGI
jgi:TP901 family phage tail tape measure protein